MPFFAVTNFNIVITLLGGWVTLFSLFSHLLKERFYLSEAFISLFAGVFFTHVVEVIRPLEYAGGSAANVEAVTLNFTRLVLGVQLVLAGVQLPSRYLRIEWRSLSLLLGPGMLGMWACTALLVWLLIPGLPVLGALALAACVTPTDPVLSNTILRGRFAEENVPLELRNVIIAESGANDGLGYGFLFLALYLLQAVPAAAPGATDVSAVAGALARWLGETCAWMVLLSVAYGWAVGWAARKALHWAEKRGFVDRESFFVFAIALALLLVGSCGLVGTDDVLACFVAGNAFTWDDWFRVRTADDSLQPNVDNLLNAAVFMWLGAVCPWELFVSGDTVPVWRLVLFGALVLALRRLPTILALHRYVPQIEDWRQAVFVGYFGPIGVSAMFYLFVTLEFLDNMAAEADGGRTDTERLKDTARLVVWFLTICSIVVHGLSIPLSKLGTLVPGRRTKQPIMLPP